MTILLLAIVLLYGDNELHYFANNACSTVAKVVVPRSTVEGDSKQSQPSLKPSSICIRGSGFFMPCDRKSDFQESRGTAFMATGRFSRMPNVAAIFFRRHELWTSSSTTLFS